MSYLFTPVVLLGDYFTNHGAFIFIYDWILVIAGIIQAVTIGVMLTADIDNTAIKNDLTAGT